MEAGDYGLGSRVKNGLELRIWGFEITEFEVYAGVGVNGFRVWGLGIIEFKV